MELRGLRMRMIERSARLGYRCSGFCAALIVLCGCTGTTRGVKENYMANINPEWEVSVFDVKKMMDARQPMLLLDVREKDEHKICNIKEATLVPLSELDSRTAEVQKMAGDRPVIIHCHHGGRSLRAAELLRSRGLANCKSMAGGIEVWSTAVDSSVPRY